MNENLKSNERELVKLASFFKKQSRALIDEGKLGEEHVKVGEVVDRFIEQMEAHANWRAAILEQRELFSKLVKDDAVCPSCQSREMLKFAGTEKNEKGWKSNRYKCRKCNIEFTWNKPNNPWDLLAYMEELLPTLRAKVALSDSVIEKGELSGVIDTIQANLDRLKPTIEGHNAEFETLQLRESEMEKLIHEFNNSLQIEKIKMNTWENRR